MTPDSETTVVGRVGGLWRYPIKSLDGEPLEGEGFPEDGWIERTLALGSVRLRITERVVRCVMLNQRRPNLRARRDVLKLVGSLNQACAGVYADVFVPGEVRIGDPVAR